MAGIIKERLFTPGPTPLLLEAQLRALTMTLHHRTDAFRTLMRETLDNLRYYFNTRNDVILFASSGTVPARERWRARFRTFFRRAIEF